MDRLIVMIVNTGDHWVVAVVDVSEKIVRFYDSYLSLRGNDSYDDFEGYDFMSYFSAASKTEMSEWSVEVCFFILFFFFV